MAQQQLGILLKINADTKDGQAALASIGKQLEGLNDSAKTGTSGMADSFKRAKTSVDEFGASAAVQMGMGGALGAIVAFTAKSVTSLAEFEDIMIDVQKTTGMAAPEVQKLGDSLREMATVDLQGVVGADALGKIAASAGSLGISGAPKIEAFTLAIAEMSVAAEMGAAETATSMAELENAFRTGLEKAGQSAESQTANIGSAFNALENTTSATTAQILDVTQRMAGAADTIGLTVAQTAGIGATIRSLGVDTEVGGTAMSKFFLDMLTNSRDWATALNLDSDKVANAMKTNPVEAIQMVVKGMGELKDTSGPAALAEALDELGVKDTRLIDAMLKLSGASEKLDQNIKVSNEAFKAGTSLHDEFLVKASSSVSQWQGLGEKSKEVFRSFGEELKPATELLSDWASGGLDVVISAAGEWQSGVKEEFFDAVVEDAEAIKQTFADVGDSISAGIDTGVAAIGRLGDALDKSVFQNEKAIGFFEKMTDKIYGVEDALEGHSLTPAMYNYVKAAQAAGDETETGTAKFKAMAEQVDFADERSENLAYGLSALRQATEDAAAAQAEANAEFQQTYAEDLAQSLNTLRDAYEETYEAAEYPESALLSMRAATGIIEEQKLSLEDYVGIANAAADSFGQLSSNISSIGDLFGFDTSGIENLLGKAQQLAQFPETIKGIKDAVGGIGEAFGKLKDFDLSKILSGGGGLSGILSSLGSIAGIGGLIAAAWGPLKDLLGNLFKNTKSEGTEAALAMQEFVKSGVSGGAELASAMGAAFDTMSANSFDFQASLQASGSTMSQVMGGISSNWQQGSTAMDVFTVAVGRATGDMQKAPQVALQMMMGFDQMGLSAEQAGAKMLEVAAKAGMSSAEIEKLKAALAAGGEEGASTTAVFDSATAAEDDLIAKTQDLSGEIGGLTSQLSGAGAEGGDTAAIFRTASGAASDLSGRTDQLSGQVRDLTNQMGSAGSSTIQASNVFGTASGAADNLSGNMSGLADMARNAGMDVDTLKRLLELLPAKKDIEINVKTNGSVPAMASGGEVGAMGLAIVNEQGSEIADIPGRGMVLMTARGPVLGAFPVGTEIIPHSRSMQLLRDDPTIPRIAPYMAAGGTVAAAAQPAAQSVVNNHYHQYSVVLNASVIDRSTVRIIESELRKLQSLRSTSSL